MKNLTSAAIGTRLEAVARAVAPAMVAVYVAGYMLGTWLHTTNDRLAAAHVRLLGHAPAAQPQAPRIKATRHAAPLTVEALVAAHTQRELMAMAGTKSKRSKKQLAERILSK
jgi:hypothetical protein